VSGAEGVNSAGQVVGYSGLGGQGEHAVLWDRTGSGSFSVTDLGTLPGGSLSSALAINDAGVIAGNSDTVEATSHAVVWRATSSGSYGMPTLGRSPVMPPAAPTPSTPAAW
jgi:probable HAF family extracellular repeat protein